MRIGIRLLLKIHSPIPTPKNDTGYFSRRSFLRLSLSTAASVVLAAFDLPVKSKNLVMAASENDSIIEIYPGELSAAFNSTLIQPGSKLLLHDGTYSGDFIFNHNGALNNPIEISPFNNERPIIGRFDKLFMVNTSI